jgi:uncharacterized protein (TIGR00299 family) protein
MKIAYFNCSSGIAGDMIQASLIDSGLSHLLLEKKLKSCLKLPGWRYQIEQTDRNHFPAKLLRVKGGEKEFRHPREMIQIMKKSTLPTTTKQRALNILSTLIAAEAKVHGVPEEKVHFHELSSMDTIIDIAGSCLALELSGITEVFASAINIGRAAPATLEIIKNKQVSVYSTTSQFEMATPTGVAIIATLATHFGTMPVMRLGATGAGAGEKIFPGQANILQVMMSANDQREASHYTGDRLVLLETNIDDMDPRVYPYVMELLFKNNARDTWLTPVIMKKSRPGILLSCLCETEEEPILTDILFRETTTLGIRRQAIERTVLARKMDGTRKTALLRNNLQKTSIEFEKARQIALRTGRPLYRILEEKE